MSDACAQALGLCMDTAHAETLLLSGRPRHRSPSERMASSESAQQGGSSGDGHILPVIWSARPDPPSQILLLRPLQEEKTGVQVVLGTMTTGACACTNTHERNARANSSHTNPATELVVIKMYDLSQPDLKRQGYSEMEMLRRVSSSSSSPSPWSCCSSPTAAGTTPPTAAGHTAHTKPPAHTAHSCARAFTQRWDDAPPTSHDMHAGVRPHTDECGEQPSHLAPDTQHTPPFTATSACGHVCGGACLCDARTCGVCAHRPPTHTHTQKRCARCLHDESTSAAAAHVPMQMQMQPCESTHVVGLIAAMDDGQSLHLVMPYLEGGDLFDRIDRSGGGLPVHEARRYFRHMVRGLLNLKAQHVVHGDVSLENVMLSPSRDGRCLDAHLIDLGSSSSHVPGATCVSGDYMYRGKLNAVPPESVVAETSEDVDPYAIDVWGLGTCLYAMLTGRPLYLHPNDTAFRFLCTNRTSNLMAHYQSFGLPDIDTHARALLLSILQPTPSQRPTLEQIMQHPWMDINPL